MPHGLVERLQPVVPQAVAFDDGTELFEVMRPDDELLGVVLVVVFDAAVAELVVDKRLALLGRHVAPAVFGDLDDEVVATVRT